MPIHPADVEAIVFDYGNTLIPFGHDQVNKTMTTLHQDLERLRGPVDPARLEALCIEARHAPFAGDDPHFREHDFEVLLASIVENLFGAPPAESELAQLRRARHDQFVDLIAVEDHVHETLRQLRSRFRLGLLSNYPDAPAIRTSLDKVGLSPYFETIVVSGEVGFCKPHPVCFAYSLAALGLPASRAVYVGDNWLADVQGAKRVGMGAIHMRRWETVEQYPPQAGDHQPDATIDHLSELTGLLLQ